MLTSEKRDQIADAAWTIQAAAARVRLLMENEPREPRGVALEALVLDLELARRRLLEAWS